MFGYCHKDYCRTDLWAPGNRSDIENRAFSGYAKHEQEIEDIIVNIVAHARIGDLNFNIEIDDDLSDNDLAYIQKEVARRLE